MSKAVVLFFNAEHCKEEIPLGDLVLKPSESITYLGLPISQSLFSTRMLLVRHIEMKIWIVYGLIIGNRHQFGCKYLALLYNAITLPHALHIAPICKYLSSAQCAKVKVLFFQFKKVLFMLPQWMSNSYSIDSTIYLTHVPTLWGTATKKNCNYGASDQAVSVTRVAENYLKNDKRRVNPLKAILCREFC